MSSNDQKLGRLPLAYYACAIYSLAAAALLHWRVDEAVLGYDPNHDSRGFRIFLLVLLSAGSVHMVRVIKSDRYEHAKKFMLSRFGMEAPSVASICWPQIAGIVAVSSLIVIVRI